MANKGSQEAGEQKPPAVKRGLKRFFGILLVLFLLSGMIFGLRVSGGLDEIFSFVSPVLSQFPLVGEPLVALMDSVERPLNSQERRALELEEMDAALVSREEVLREASRNLEADRARLEKLREELEREKKKAQKAAQVPATSGNDAEAVTSLARGFEDMSSRKAAGIISKLTRQRALQIMRALSQEKMAEVLAKMDPGTAAKMVEALSQGGATGTAGFE